MTRRWTGLENPFLTEDANTLFDFPSLRTAKTDTIALPSSVKVKDAKNWLEEMSLTLIEVQDEWTGEDQVRCVKSSGENLFSFVNPQHAMMFRLTFGGVAVVAIA